MNQTRASDQRCWIISPVFDLCFVINVWWVLALFVSQSHAVGVNASTSIEFWQIYFLTAPHRWMTLVLVASDPDRRDGRGSLFAGMAVVAALVVMGVWLGFRSFGCLILVDFVWNAWHFASQHGGVLRIYGRMGGGGRPNLERWGIRIFVTYTALRTAAWLSGMSEIYPWLESVINVTDLAVLSLPAAIVICELADRPWQRRGKMIYLLNIIAMYTVLLLAIRNRDTFLVFAMSAATAAFHAVEYLAIVTFYAWRRQTTGSDSPFRTMARHWLRVLLTFIILMGMISQYADRHFRDIYIGLNLWAAFLHYAYDGMIWKLRRPSTAQALNVQLDTSSTASA